MMKENNNIKGVGIMNYFIIKDVKEIYIDDVLFDTVNGYKFYYKDNNLYFKMINQVTDDNGFKKIKNVIRQLTQYENKTNHNVKFVEELKYEDGSKRETCTYMECEIPEGDIFEFNCNEISNMGFTFRVKDIK